MNLPLLATKGTFVFLILFLKMLLIFIIHKLSRKDSILTEGKILLDSSHLHAF